MGELAAAARAGRSVCQQMLMGEGKTTVISPLLALLLADGSQLLMQIVPAPLLAFSLGVLRSVFGPGALLKPVWTFAFDRRATVTAELLEKAHTAVAERAVMVSTPAAVKAQAVCRAGPPRRRQRLATPAAWGCQALGDWDALCTLRRSAAATQDPS